MNSSPSTYIVLTAFLGLTSAALADAPSAKHYDLPASAENVQWGWYDPNEPPKLRVHSGDTVSIETLPHALGQIKPGAQMEDIVKLRKQNAGGGPHSMERQGRRDPAAAVA